MSNKNNNYGLEDVGGSTYKYTPKQSGRSDYKKFTDIDKNEILYVDEYDDVRNYGASGNTSTLQNQYETDDYDDRDYSGTDMLSEKYAEAARHEMQPNRNARGQRPNSSNDGGAGQYRPSQRQKSKLPLIIAGVALALLVIVGGILIAKKKFGGSSNTEDVKRLVFVGDSRTVGMYNVVTSGWEEGVDCKEADGNLWEAAVGEGYDWMMETGVPAVEGQLKKGDAVIILLGVNDIMLTPSPKDYAEYLNDKAMQWESKGISVYYVSVNPVDGDQIGNGLDNDHVDSWNSRMKDALGSSIHWIETNEKISDSYKTTDGLHYEDSTYQKIYDLVKEAVK